MAVSSLWNQGSGFLEAKDTTGQVLSITLCQALDHEERDRFELLVSVQNQSPLELSTPKAARALATIRVHVLDANEAPFFRENPWRSRVNEGAPPGTEITVFRASDPDTQQMQHLR